MKKAMKAMIVIVIVLNLSVFTANAERVKEVTCCKSGEIKTIILNIEDCTVEFDHSQDSDFKYSYDVSTVDITYKLYNQTLQVSIHGNSVQAEERELVYLAFPSSGIDLMIVKAVRSDISIDSIVETNSCIIAKDSSSIALAIPSSQPHDIKIALQNSSALFLKIEEMLENFRIDAIAADDTNHLRMGTSYPDFYSRGKYHYKKGEDNLAIYVRMAENCDLEFYTGH